ncbi:MAG: hypothetical protein LBR15_10465 [Methanobrevibacter sp.]|jgi:hypothetical protein|nr:hypothetical protein [Candidatus Methanovirga australis]
MFKNNGILLYVFLCVGLLLNISGVVANVAVYGDPDNNNMGNIIVHTCGWGSVFKANHDPVNGIAFNDNAWILSFFAHYQFICHLSNGSTFDTGYHSIYSSSDDAILYIPNETDSIEVWSGDSNNFMREVANLTTENYGNHGKIRGAIRFDGDIITGRNYHAVILFDTMNDIYTLHDSGYVNFYNKYSKYYMHTIIDTPLTFN